jgi:membrane protease YdiL (CAAX protease family)
MMKEFAASLFQTKLKFNRKIVTITIVSTLLLTIDRYHQLARPEVLDRTILYLLVPIFIIVVFFRERPSEYGFRLGDWKAGLAFTFGAVVLMTPVIWFLSRAGSPMQKYYAPLGGGMPLLVYAFLELFAWEFLFRGWLLFGYEREFSGNALWLQAVPFAIAHFGKPEIETISTLFGGFAFGWIAWRTRSFLYPFLIHWYLLSLTIILAGAVNA